MHPRGGRTTRSHQADATVPFWHVLARRIGVKLAVLAERCGRTLVNSPVEGRSTADYQKLTESIQFSNIVIHGDERGRLLGFPTANMDAADLCPALVDGVYAGTCRTSEGEVRAVAISIGHRPTFYSEEAVRLVEAHLVDFNGGLYDTILHLTFDGLLRGQIHFTGIEELTQQLRSDVEAVRTLFASGALSAPSTDD